MCEITCWRTAIVVVLRILGRMKWLCIFALSLYILHREFLCLAVFRERTTQQFHLELQCRKSITKKLPSSRHYNFRKSVISTWHSSSAMGYNWRFLGMKTREKMIEWLCESAAGLLFRIKSNFLYALPWNMITQKVNMMETFRDRFLKTRSRRIIKKK